jgi:hypothetical protein
VPVPAIAHKIPAINATNNAKSDVVAIYTITKEVTKQQRKINVKIMMEFSMYVFKYLSTTQIAFE